MSEQPQRVPLDRYRGAGLHVRGRAHFERDTAVADIAGEAAQLDGAVGGDLDVLGEPNAVAEPLGAAILHRFPDRWQAEPLSRVDRDVEVLPVDVLEGVQVAAGRPARLGACDVEPDHAVVAVPYRELGDLKRSGG